MSYFVTRWWITRGIVEVNGYMQGNYVTNERGRYLLHSEAFPSREAAEIRVRNLANRKIEKLRIQIKKLEKDWL